jgi:hypothetical protein
MELSLAPLWPDVKDLGMLKKIPMPNIKANGP